MENCDELHLPMCRFCAKRIFNFPYIHIQVFYTWIRKNFLDILMDDKQVLFQKCQFDETPCEEIVLKPALFCKMHKWWKRLRKMIFSNLCTLSIFQCCFLCNLPIKRMFTTEFNFFDHILKISANKIVLWICWFLVVMHVILAMFWSLFSNF